MQIKAPTPSQHPALRQLWKEAFGDTDAFLDTFFQTAFSPERCRCITLEDGTVPAALYWFDCLYEGLPIAYVYAVATLKAYRSRGLSHKLMEETHRFLKESGYMGVLLVPGNEGLFRFYAGMGYRTCSSINEFICTRGEVPASIEKIDTEAFSALRKAMLPHGGILQERENLRFLETQAQFYTGKDVLLAAREENGELFCLELLGDVLAAPGILNALGYEKGLFRGPGEGRDFAMYYPFHDTAPVLPYYFGFAFD